MVLLCGQAFFSGKKRTVFRFLATETSEDRFFVGAVVFLYRTASEARAARAAPPVVRKIRPCAARAASRSEENGRAYANLVVHQVAMGRRKSLNVHKRVLVVSSRAPWKTSYVLATALVLRPRPA